MKWYFCHISFKFSSPNWFIGVSNTTPPYPILLFSSLNVTMLKLLSSLLYTLNFNYLWFSFSYVECILYSYTYSFCSEIMFGDIYLPIHTVLVWQENMVFELMVGNNLMQVFGRPFENIRSIWRVGCLWDSNPISLYNIQNVWHGQESV